MEQTDYKKILLNLIGSITLSDHMGDVADDVRYALEQIGMKEVVDEADSEKYGWDEWWPNLGTALGVRGVTTLHGTILSEPKSEDE